MKLITLITLIGFGFLVSSLHIKNLNAALEKRVTPDNDTLFKAQLKIFVDDELLKVTINGSDVPIDEIPDKGNAGVMKNISVLVKFGDIIQISAKNNGKITSTNPASIAGALIIQDINDNIIAIPTSKKWICGSKSLPALEIPIQNTAYYAQTVQSQIHPSALPIWEYDNVEESITCSLVLDKSYINNELSIGGNVDIIKSVKINDKNVPVSTMFGVNERMIGVTCQISKVEICASTTKDFASNPVGIISTFKNFNGKSAMNVFSTDLEWKCNSNGPIAIGSNSIINPMQTDSSKLYPNFISKSAYWIWSAGLERDVCCSINIENSEIPANNALLRVAVTDGINVDEVMTNSKVNTFKQTKLGSTILIPIKVKTGYDFQIKLSKTGAVVPKFAITITHLNNAGNQKIYVSNLDWTCNNQKPIEASSPISGASNIHESSKYIWANPGDTSIVCNVKLTRGISFLTAYVDDMLLNYSINGVSVNYTGAQSASAQIILYPALGPGDRFEMCGKNINNEGFKFNNPASFTATIKYFDYNDELITQNTNENWVCNNALPRIYSINNQSGNLIRTGTKMAGVNPEANMIWSTDDLVSACCSITLPGQKVTKNFCDTNAEIHVAADAFLYSIEVDDYQLGLPRSFPDNWTEGKKIKASLKSGSKISFTALRVNSANPGIVAKITYKSTAGDKTIVTDDTWTCNGDSSDPIPKYNKKCDTVPSGAYWIWSKAKPLEEKVTCTIILP